MCSGGRCVLTGLTGYGGNQFPTVVLNPNILYPIERTIRSEGRFAINIFSPKGPAESATPGFVYGIVISLFVLFNSFALVQWKQYKAQGKWANYLYGERMYIVLSLIAKSALAWQIFSGALAV